MNASAFTVTIGTLDASTAEAAIPALTDILRDSVANGASVGFMNGNTAPDYERFWRGVATGVACGQIILLAARNEDGIVGTAQLHLIGKPNQPHRAEIAKVLVHSRARRQGIGEALMQRAEAIAREKGRDLLVLDTDEHGAARRLYNRLGWTEAGTIPRYALMPDGSDCGSTFFYKSLA
ncbi:MAG: GNAT family N-acetyltransferase [Bosea sp.]|uniref:GNAT family N-acetyltransferase n=1 Tax=Bosea sp. (in: a-proteobacteria) TaxID=1871050 RepID=UPI001AD5FD86|nr:GNAT family N-acetyltransferase [Bosea sp. (in: a-proteobacteria)]MBN9453037.1 GNAT family N-acetyltransferase [Bosea sp. (in: a-proteobacteria)]